MENLFFACAVDIHALIFSVCVMHFKTK